ncbi:MAG: hypothetical protein Q7J48_20920 [Nocardioides sp.]|nr:hypothetical protein [Nocardioides sp.]
MDNSPTQDRTGDVPGRRIVELACGAPSVHNTQPWLWRIDGMRIELHADASRRLEVADPSGRNLVMSCGAALHHACVAAAALGYPAEVEYPAETSDHLATLHLTPRPRTPRAVEDLAALGQRSTDRRRFTSWPVPEQRLARLAAAVDVPGVRVVPLVDVTSRFRVELLVNRALDQQAADERYAEEHQRWLDRSHVDGIPTAAVPDLAGHPRSQPSRFGQADTSEPRDLVENSDGLLVICTDDDDQHSWLLAGQALSQMWLAATVDGLSVVPLSQVIELPATRESLRHEVLGGLTRPQIITRIGWQEIGRSELPRTPRRPVDEVLIT